MNHHSTTAPVHKVAFIIPPGWFDISPTEFLRVAPGNTIAMQTTMRPPDFDYSVEQVRAAVPELLVCAQSLAATGADVIAQFGYPFSLVHGWKHAQEVQQRIEDTVKTPFVMMGVEVIRALMHLRCRSVAVASTYYSHQMGKVLGAYLNEAGVQVESSANWQSQGIAEESDSGIFVGKGALDPMGWETPEWAVEKAVHMVARDNPSSDCILVTGGGMRLLHLVARLEKETGKTIVAGDLTLYWGISRRLGRTEGVTGHGRLLANPV